jgi:hypothetical protein
MEQHLKNTKDLLENLSGLAESSRNDIIASLEGKKRWVEDTAEVVRRVEVDNDEAAALLQGEMFSQLMVVQGGLKDCLKRLKARTPDGTEATGVFFDTGNSHDYITCQGN